MIGSEAGNTCDRKCTRIKGWFSSSSVMDKPTPLLPPWQGVECRRRLNDCMAPPSQDAECLQVLATAVSSLDTVCSATLDFVGTFDGNTGDQSPPDAVFCRVNASTATATQVLSMSATASQSLAEFACEDPSESQAMQTATVCPPSRSG